MQERIYLQLAAEGKFTEVHKCFHNQAEDYVLDLLNKLERILENGEQLDNNPVATPFLKFVIETGGTKHDLFALGAAFNATITESQKLPESRTRKIVTHFDPATPSLRKKKVSMKRTLPRKRTLGTVANTNHHKKVVQEKDPIEFRKYTIVERSIPLRLHLKKGLDVVVILPAYEEFLSQECLKIDQQMLQHLRKALHLPNQHFPPHLPVVTSQVLFGCVKSFKPFGTTKDLNLSRVGSQYTVVSLSLSPVPAEIDILWAGK